MLPELPKNVDDPIIFVIEDDDVDAMSITRAFSQCWQDAMVIRARTGEEALELLSGFRPSIILLDIAMPGLSGIEVLAAIKSMEPLLGVPTIMCSGSDSSEDIQKCHELNANAYSLKPSSAAAYREYAISIKSFWRNSTVADHSIDF